MLDELLDLLGSDDILDTVAESPEWYEDDAVFDSVVESYEWPDENVGDQTFSSSLEPTDSLTDPTSIDSTTAMDDGWGATTESTTADASWGSATESATTGDDGWGATEESEWRWLKDPESGWTQVREDSLWDEGTHVEVPGDDTEYGSWGGSDDGWFYAEEELSSGDTDAIDSDDSWGTDTSATDSWDTSETDTATDSWDTSATDTSATDSTSSSTTDAGE